MNKWMFILIMTIVMGSVAHGLSDDFEDGVKDTQLWVWGAEKWGWQVHPPGDGNWDYSHEEIMATDGYLQTRVWGPMSGNTYGADAWVRTKKDFNDGKSYLVNFTWEADVVDYHVNHYLIQITNGYIPNQDDFHWPSRPAPGTTNLLWGTDSQGNPTRGRYLTSGLAKSDWSITINPSGVARLYDGPNATGSVLHEGSLDPSEPWYVRLMVSDGTSMGFPAGDARLNLYDFSTVSEPPCPPPPSVPPWSFVQFTDTHIGVENARDALIAAVHEINHLSSMPEFVLVTGDISDAGCNENDGCNSLGNYNLFTTIMGLLDIPYYPVPGNHDRRKGLNECEPTLACYEAEIIGHRPTVNSFPHLSSVGNYWFEPAGKGYIFIGLDTGSNITSGNINDQMDDLIELGNNNKCMLKIVFMHHPGVDYWGITDQSVQNDDFLDWCDDNKVRLVLAGHTHQDHVSNRYGTMPDPSVPWIGPIYVQTPGRGKYDSGQRAFRIFDVDGGIVSEDLYILNILNNRYEVQPNSPVEVHVYDSQGQHVGVDPSGEIKEGEITGSYYLPQCSVETEDGSDVYPEKIIIFNPTDDYLCEVVGTEEGTYGLNITLVIGGQETTFKAADIPTSPGARHIYAVDWQALSAGEEGVIINIDKNGDGFFEQMVIADNELSYDEFALQTETVVDFDPDTLNLNSQGKFATVYIELPEDIDASEIDLFSLALNELVHPLPKPIEIGDYDSDGINDLMVKFDLLELMEVLEPGEQIIDLTGQLWDGRPIAGFDFIRVIH